MRKWIPDVISVRPSVEAHAHKLVALSFWALLLVGYLIYMQRSGLAPADVAGQVRNLLAATSVGPIVYVLLYTVRPLILFPASVLTAVAGFVYGPWWGLFYACLGANLSASLAYTVGRYFGAGLLQEEDGKRLAGYARSLRSNGFEAVLIMRLVYLPYDMVNYLAGFVQVRWPAYGLATLLGSLPAVVTFVLLGAAVLEDSSTQRWILLGFSAGVLAVGVVLAQLLRRRKALAE